MSIDAMRWDYEGAPLDPADVADDPIAWFRRWFQEAEDRVGVAANVMCCATSDRSGRPAARMLLLKGIDHGFRFYTSAASPTGRDLAANPRVALVLYWEALERQVRIEGAVERLDAASVARYFHSRPRGSQIAARASRQSAAIDSRAELERRFAAEDRACVEGAPVPMPDDWAGYRVLPARIEFWQGRRNRLHDRVACRRVGEVWETVRLQP